MTCNDKMVSIFRHGINNDNIGPIAKASFEETPEMFLKAAKHGELDNMRGVSANVMCGQTGYYGTSSFDVLIDLEELGKMNIPEEVSIEVESAQEIIEKGFANEELQDEICSLENIIINKSIHSVKKMDMGDDNEYDMDF
jgi:DNA-directed RNA polymerase II subunit RPB1